MNDEKATRKAIAEVHKAIRDCYRRLSYILPILNAMKAIYDQEGIVDDQLAKHIDTEMLTVLRILNQAHEVFKGEDIPF